ncbi:signal transduction histidine kinase [Lentimicrobium saccharophilum]|uniref:histidine kinase n=1 Tax=Lentimicrobium saccharophilum TaxID=1678841 RepID=A0A0S7C219_9BACT|nr:ATP-binding protein [Lentimicrobium saccharophilum]GAP44658.1 signal transduction histidine kinase [Lentimicrobium saccharophilum]
MKKIRFEYRFTFIYLLLGLLWILFSDRLIGSLVTDPVTLTRIQTYKGWFYVILTAILFFHILKTHLIKLRTAEKKAVESDRLKTAFLQNISHEIRTPMNGIIGFSSLLGENGLTEDQKKEYVTYIMQSANRLLDLVNQVLDISLIETGNISVNNRPVSLNALLKDIFRQWHPVIKEEVELKLSCGLPDHSDSMITDEYKLKQILNNLVGNAVKFTEKGHVHFGYSLRDNEIEFFVKDTGIGIDNRFHADIFQRFRKAEPSSSKFYDGAGLGLAICQSNLELMNGKISLESEPGHGSLFRFTLPYKPAKTVLPKESIAAVAPEPASLSGVNILVAEDEILNYKYIEDLLSGTGVNLISAVNGSQAVDYCRDHSDVHLVLMDIRMPVMDGLEATKRIKELRPDLPVIAQSAYIEKDRQPQVREAGFDDFLFKPFLKEELMDAIAGFLYTRKPGSSGPNQ